MGWMLSTEAVRKLVSDHNQLWQLYRSLTRELAAFKTAVLPLRRPRQRFLNNSGEEAPAYAVMEVTAGVRGSSGNPFVEERLTITKPTSTFRRLYLVNGPRPVAAGSEGEGTWLMDDAAGRPVLYNSSDGTPAYGESWGAKASQWTLAKNRPGFLITGANNTSASNPYTSAVQYVVNEVLGKTAAPHNEDASGTVRLWMGTANSETDSSMDITAYNKFANLGSGVWVWCSWTNGAWYLTAGDC